MKGNKWELEDFIAQNQRRVYYQMNRLHIENEKEDYFQEGLVAMWKAYEKHDPDKGPLATYMNYQIRNKLVDAMRKSITEKKYFQQLSYQQKIETQSGNYMDRMKTPFAEEGKNQSEMHIDFLNESDFEKYTNVLTVKQKRWFCHAIVDGLSNQEIAEKEEVTVEAVKSWAKSTKRKLRSIDWD